MSREDNLRAMREAAWTYLEAQWAVAVRPVTKSVTKKLGVTKVTTDDERGKVLAALRKLGRP